MNDRADQARDRARLERLAQESGDVARRLERSIDALRAAGDARAGCTPREVVHRDGMTTLYRYQPVVETPAKPPLLIVYALVNRPEIADLQADRSLIRGLLEAGRDVHLIDWGTPGDAERDRPLCDYAVHAVDGCVEALRERARCPRVDVLGICQGGTFSLCYTALHPHKVRALVTMVTPVDFHTPDNLLRQWVRHLDVDRLVETVGNVPGELLNHVFVALKPLRLGAKKYLDMLEQVDDPERMAGFTRMERWINDSPPQAGRAFAEFIRWLYQENRLVRGTLELDGRLVSLAAIDCPILNVYATRDHIVPPASCLALGDHLSDVDYDVLAFEGGHIGIYSSARAQREVPPGIAVWLSGRTDTDERAGSGGTGAETRR